MRSRIVTNGIPLKDIDTFDKNDIDPGKGVTGEMEQGIGWVCLTTWSRVLGILGGGGAWQDGAGYWGGCA